MLAKLLKLFSENSNDQSAIDREKLIKLSVAALLVEISLADSEMGKEEVTTMMSIIKSEFSCSEEEANQILEDAKNQVEDSVSLYEFTNYIKDELSLTERSNIIKQLWKVAYADAVLDKYEEYYVRKIADLLYVPQANYIKAKLSALNE